MATLRDFLDAETLRQFQAAFSAVAAAPVRICDPDGEELLGETGVPKNIGAALGQLDSAEQEPTGECVAIRVDGERVGCVRLETASLDAGVVERVCSDDQQWRRRVLMLAAGVLTQVCRRQEQLDRRIEQLTTLYQLTAEFSGQRDLQSVLDTVARTVVDVLDAKGCSIRLLNEEHTELLVKAVAGLSKQYVHKGPILVSRSRIDQEALSTGEPVYVADEQADERVLYPAEAASEGIVSALCAPMVYKGESEGVIHVYTSEPHVFDAVEISLLKSIAAQAAAAIVNARLNQEAVRSATIQRELELAGEVQRRMIPAAPPALEGFEIEPVYVPSYQLSGDFYDFIDLPPDNLGLAICDVSGKGVRASLLMAAVRASLRAHAVNIYDMVDVLRKVNRDLCNSTLVSDFASLFYAVLDFRTRRLTYANAGHPPPILVRRGELCHLHTGGGVLGVDCSQAYRQEWFTLEPGDYVLAYTDGLTEAMNFNDEIFGRERVEQAVLEAVGDDRSAQGLSKHVLWCMRRFAGLQTRFDDLTMLAIKVL
ncbi:MAG: PP2C family protein-serine/threonine phosphatase [Phycisphaerae bacterium]